MIVRHTVACSTCNHAITLRIQVGHRPYQEHTFHCPECGEDIVIGMDCDADRSCNRNGEQMKDLDKYHKWVEWSEEDQVYIGKCPDLITGIHGDDPVALYGELCEVVQDVVSHFKTEGRSLPRPRVRPMSEVA